MNPSSFEQRVRQGQCYTVSTPNLTAGIATNVRFTIQNPSASLVKNLCIYCVEMAIGISGILSADFYLDPTNNLPTTVLTPANQNTGSSNTSGSVVKSDTGAALSGGTKLFTLSQPGNSRNPYKEQLIMIPPGHTLGVNMPLALGLSAIEKMDFWEEQ